MSPFIRQVRTTSGATAVQVVFSQRGGKKNLRHVGSAHTPAELELLLARAREILQGDQLAFDFGLVESPVGSVDNPVPVTSQRAGYLLDCIDAVYDTIGFSAATGNDTVFRDLVRARIIDPGSKLQSIETLSDVGVQSASYATIKRHLPEYATEPFREVLSQALAGFAGIGQGSLVLYDVTTLYYETDIPDDLRKPGFSKERRVEPQIVVGLLADASGFPLNVGAFEGNKAETKTMLPVIQAFQDAYRLESVTVVADAGMFSAANKKALREAGLDYILSTRVPNIPEVIKQWMEEHPGQSFKDGQSWTASGFDDARSSRAEGKSLVHYVYSEKRAKKTLHGLEKQYDKARTVIEEHRSVKSNRYVKLVGAKKQLDEELYAKHQTLAGLKGYETSRQDLSVDAVLGAYRQLLNVEKSFRMSKSDLKARPIFAWKKDSIEAHLNVVMAALAVSHVLEQASGMSIKRLVRELRRYRTIELDVGGHTMWAQTPAVSYPVSKI
ncbi:transposase [Corynebacterium sp. 13CS0277]|uniref:IS1634 family transposase n=1 Tax=Corynebacterium sp. 13CS0277 TaxID=2071994 RepID=UPI000D046FCE|nr:IS1634 family transposase [Corynebacterium sp. 13CS0277]PRQ10564.1 transposase [Corynebacterium sp. 13CS0277]